MNEILWKQGCGGSQVWKKMLLARDLVEHQIYGNLTKEDPWCGMITVLGWGIYIPCAAKKTHTSRTSQQ